MPLLPQPLKEKFRCGEFARNVMTVASGTIVAQVILAVSVLALTRLYNPGDVGLLANYMAIGTVVALAVTGRYEQAIMLPEDDRDALDLARLSLVLAGIGTLVCLLAIVFSYQKLASMLHTPSMEGWFFVLLVTIFLNAARTTLTFLLNRWKRYRGLAASRMWNAIAAVALKLMLFPLAQAGLLIGALAGQFAGMGMMVKQARKDVPGSHSFRWQNLKRVAKTYKNFPCYMMPAALTESISLYLPVLGSGFYFSKEISGQFSAAMGLLCLPGAIIGSAIAQVFYQECTVSIQKGEFLKVRALLFRTWTRMFFATLIPMGAIYFWGPEIFRFVLGEKWGMAGMYGSILVPLFLSDLIRSPTASTFISLGLQRASFQFSLLTLGARALGIFIAVERNRHYVPGANGSIFIPESIMSSNFADGIAIAVMIEVFIMAAFNARIIWELRRRRIAQEKTPAGIPT